MIYITKLTACYQDALWCTPHRRLVGLLHSKIGTQTLNLWAIKDLGCYPLSNCFTQSMFVHRNLSHGHCTHLHVFPSWKTTQSYTGPRSWYLSASELRTSTLAVSSSAFRRAYYKEKFGWWKVLTLTNNELYPMSQQTIAHLPARLLDLGGVDGDKVFCVICYCQGVAR